MNKDNISQILLNRAFPDTGKHLEMIETHISWVILSDHFAFKIKKPVKYSFLDFSTPALRRKYCYNELALNRRLSPEIYLGVDEIRSDGKETAIGEGPGEVIDYAVRMKRLRTNARMDLMLIRKKVKRDHVDRIARILVDFHQTTEIIHKKINREKILEDFNDLQSVKPFLREKLGNVAVNLIDRSVECAGKFVHRFGELMQLRSDQGFVRDGHGDLHTGNIFLLSRPVIFDCIEFNDDFRQIDVLDEIAFLCMDLERFGRRDLSHAFLEKYLSETRVLRNEAEGRLFLFFKLYRANVKAKIQAIKAQNASSERAVKKHLVSADIYLHLMSDYLSVL